MTKSTCLGHIPSCSVCSWECSSCWENSLHTSVKFDPLPAHPRSAPLTCRWWDVVNFSVYYVLSVKLFWLLIPWVFGVTHGCLRPPRANSGSQQQPDCIAWGTGHFRLRENEKYRKTWGKMFYSGKTQGKCIYSWIFHHYAASMLICTKLNSAQFSPFAKQLKSLCQLLLCSLLRRVSRHSFEINRLTAVLSLVVTAVL